MSLGLLTNLAESVRASINRGSLDKAAWVCDNFRNPKRPSEPWSFKDHEFQTEILNCGDDVPLLVVEKCAQVGLTTLEIVDTLTFCALHEALKVGYVLPTAKFATDFSPLRIDPIVSQSPRIASIMSADTDNRSTKKIGSCFLVMRGTTGETQAISVDLDMLIVDELNYCNQKVLSSFASRLQHSDLKLQHLFSTPTLPDFGISKLMKQGSQALRAVRCPSCETQVFPDFFRDLSGPVLLKYLSDTGKKTEDLRPEDSSPIRSRLQQTGETGEQVYLRCSACASKGKETPLLTQALNDPDRREWIHADTRSFAEGRRSYSVKPWDVPKYNPAQDVLLSMENYAYGDWVNFRLGLTHESAENSFMVDTIRAQHCTVKPVGIAQLRLGPSNSGIGPRKVFIGADLGKTNHVAIGLHNPSSKTLDIVCAAKVTLHDLNNLYGEANFGKWLEDLFKKTLAARMVVDSMPNYQTSLYVSSALPQGMAYGAYYVTRGTLSPDIYNFKEQQGVVSICRNEGFEEVCSAANSGGVRFPYADSPDMEEFLSHLGNIKKVKTLDGRGNPSESWENLGDDHYAHALLYCWAAYSSVEKRFVAPGVGAPVGVSAVRMK